MILNLACAVLSSILYRAGGLARTQRYWLPLFMRRSWVRDWLCPLCVLLPLFIQHPSWWFVLAYGALGGALTTYWDWLFEFDNYWFSGCVAGLALLPLALCGFSLVTILVKALVLAVAWGVWSLVWTNDHAEEHGRGFLLAVILAC